MSPTDSYERTLWGLALVALSPFASLVGLQVGVLGVPPDWVEACAGLTTLITLVGSGAGILTGAIFMHFVSARAGTLTAGTVAGSIGLLGGFFVAALPSV